MTKNPNLPLLFVHPYFLAFVAVLCLGGAILWTFMVIVYGDKEDVKELKESAKELGLGCLVVSIIVFSVIAIPIGFLIFGYLAGWDTDNVRLPD